MMTPRILFTHWVKWKDREQLNKIKLPGVYLLARFDNNAPLGPASPLKEQVIYIGETCANSLLGRWRQFNRSAFHGRKGHSGGVTYRQVFGDKGNNLYVAALPIDKLDKKIQSFFIRYIERKLLWNYIVEWNVPPRCNRK